MPQENIFSGSLAHKIGQRMMAIITHAPKGERTRLGEARRLGISYVIEYASPGLSDNEPTLKARRYAVNLVLGRMFGTGDVVRPDLAARLVTFEYMFPFASPEIQRQYGANFQRFCLLRIPDYSFDDLDVLLKPIRRNSYDFGYELRDALNDAPSAGRHGIGAGDPGQQVVQVVPDKPFDFTFKCHNEPQGDLSTMYGWEVDAMELPAAWLMAPPVGGKQFGEGIIVGHPDTGYSDHPALSGASPKLLKNKGDNPADGGTDAKDDLNKSLFNSEPGHGTMTGSLIVSGSEIVSGSAAQPIKATVPTGGVVGCAPRARLVPIRVCDSTAFVENAHVAQGVLWAVQQGCHVVSISVGGFFIPGIQSALKAAYDADMVVVAAAGNCEPFVVSPACFNTCFAVGASDENEKYWEHSAFGPKVAIAAPGVIVRSTFIDKQGMPIKYSYNTGAGCSFSTAFAAGACALWLSFFGRDKLIALNKGRLQDLFARAARTSASAPPGWDAQQWGAGILNARQLLAVDPATLGSTPPANNEVDEVDTFLKFLAWAVKKTDSVGDIFPTLMGWFGVETEAEVRAILGDHGFEIVNGVIQSGLADIEGAANDIFDYLKDIASNGLGSLFK